MSNEQEQSAANKKRIIIIEHLKELLEEEISEAGSRIVKAIIAEQEGSTKAASVLREIAYNEAKHAVLIAKVLPDSPFADTRANIQSSIEGDSDAAQREKDFARIAREAGMEDIAKLFQQLSTEETEHVKKLKEALQSS
jgi:rubrerythrin